MLKVLLVAREDFPSEVGVAQLQKRAERSLSSVNWRFQGEHQERSPGKASKLPWASLSSLPCLYSSTGLLHGIYIIISLISLLARIYIPYIHITRAMGINTNQAPGITCCKWHPQRKGLAWQMAHILGIKIHNMKTTPTHTLAQILQ